MIIGFVMAHPIMALILADILGGVIGYLTVKIILKIRGY